VSVTVTANNRAVVLFDQVITSVAGAVEAVIPVPLDTNCMKITVSSQQANFKPSCTNIHTLSPIKLPMIRKRPILRL